MKNDDTIKKFIDNKEVLTKSELSLFIYNYVKTTAAKVRIWWIYVEDTKDLKKMREYQKQKSTKNGINKLKKFKEIYAKDKRIQEYGLRKTLQLLKNIYNYKISISTLSKYKSQCSQTKV